MHNVEFPISPRRAFTLIEVMVVLGLMVLIGTMTFPAVHRRLQKSEVESAALQLKTELAQTRLKAIENGIAQKFRFQPGGNAYELSPCPDGVLSLYLNPEDDLSEYETEEEGLESPFGEEIELTTETDLEQDEQDKVLLEELPAGMMFARERPQLDEAVGEIVSQDEGEIWTDGNGWSKPIMFFPNGRSTGAQIFLNGQPNYTVALQLRGLTGTASVGETLRSRNEDTGSGKDDASSSDEVISEESSTRNEG